MQQIRIQNSLAACAGRAYHLIDKTAHNNTSLISAANASNFQQYGTIFQLRGAHIMICIIENSDDELTMLKVTETSKLKQ